MGCDTNRYVDCRHLGSRLDLRPLQGFHLPASSLKCVEHVQPVFDGLNVHVFGACVNHGLHL